MRCACSAAKARTCCEDFALQRQDLFFRRKHLAFQFLQFRRGVAFRVGQGLLAFIAGGNQRHVGLRDLDVIAEDVVEADFQRLNAGRAAFARFDGGNILLAVAADVAQFVQFALRSHREWCRRRRG